MSANGVAIKKRNRVKPAAKPKARAAPKVIVEPPPEKLTGVLKLKLGACLTAPTKRMMADLSDVAYLCNVARTAMVRAFERWHEDHPEWRPKPLVRKDGTPILDRNKRPKYRNEPLPGKDDPAFPDHPFRNADGDPITPVQYLYDVGKKVTKGVLASNILNRCSQAVWSDLQDDVPYTHVGRASYRWQAIIDHEETGLSEVKRTVYRSGVVPIRTQCTALCYCGAVRPDLSKTFAERLCTYGKSSAVLRFLIFTRESGREHMEVVCRIEVRQISEGNRRNILKIAKGKWKFCDSELVRHDDKGAGWYLHLTYEQPTRKLGLDPSRTATLSLMPTEGSHPLRVSTDGAPVWTLGDAGVLKREYERLASRRLHKQRLYRMSGSGCRGHGRSRFFATTKPWTRATRHLMERFTQHLVSRAVAYCVRNDCGTLLYREPGKGLRTKSWFARNDIPYDWTTLEARLKHKCWQYGIVFSKQIMGAVEHQGLCER